VKTVSTNVLIRVKIPPLLKIFSDEIDTRLLGLGTK